MKFDEWYDQDETIVPHDIEVYDLETAWNAAIEEAIKVAKEGHDYTPTSTAHNIAKRIKELKE